MKNNEVIRNCLKILLCILVPTIVLLFFEGCKNRINIDESSAKKLCEMTITAQKNKDFEPLLLEIEKIFKVNRQSISVQKDGIYIVIKKFTVIEDGYFISTSNKIMPGKGSDPSFKKIFDCVYKYHISG